MASQGLERSLEAVFTKGIVLIDNRNAMAAAAHQVVDHPVNFHVVAGT